jgi:hypothetical protein
LRGLCRSPLRSNIRMIAVFPRPSVGKTDHALLGNRANQSLASSPQPRHQERRSQSLGRRRLHSRLADGPWFQARCPHQDRKRRARNGAARAHVRRRQAGRDDTGADRSRGTAGAGARLLGKKEPRVSGAKSGRKSLGDETSSAIADSHARNGCSNATACGNMLLLTFAG